MTILMAEHSALTGAQMDFSKVDKELQMLTLTLPEASDKILLDASENYAKKLKQNTPYSDLSGKDSLRDDVFIQKTTNFNLVPQKKVGFSWSSGWYAHFSNSGTIFQDGQGFVGKTNLETKEETMNIIKSGLKEWLNGRN